MSQAELEHVAKNSLIECSQCKCVSKIPSDAYIGSVLVCPNCTASTPIDEKFWPQKKVSPDTKVLGHWAIRKPEEILEEKEQGVPAFHVLSNRVKKLTHESLETLDEMHEHIDKFAKEVINNFQDQNKYFDSWSHYLEREEAVDFAAFPFASTGIKCEQPLQGKYARLLFTPNFFTPRIGIPIKSTGGMRMQVLNSYTRLQEPLPMVLTERMNVPNQLHLNVAGTKIYGASLASCVGKIPGIHGDLDHSLYNPSVFINNSLAARTWLAGHGVVPWEKIETNPAEELESPTIVAEAMKSSPINEVLWKRFLEHGRISIWTDMLREVKEFIAYAACSMKGLRILFTANKRTRVQWPHKNNLCEQTHLPDSKFIPFINGDEIVWDALYRSRLVIVDLTEDIDPCVLERLYKYGGKVICVGRNPLFDFNGHDYYANLVHGLVSKQITMYKHGIDFNFTPIAAEESESGI